MASPRTSIRRRAGQGGFTPYHFSRKSDTGFTLLEILVVMALITIVAGFGLSVSFDTFRASMFRNERDILVSALQRARSQAVNNMCFGASCAGGMAHGVHIEAGQYVIFQGYVYSATDPINEALEKQDMAASITGATDIVFSPLAATTSGAAITVSEAGQSSVISIGTEGGISWTQ